jgi:hypothetical protein
MELNVTLAAATDQSLGFIGLQKMYFIHNAIEAGWSVKKRNDKYIFAKKHENKKEVYLETYLQNFIEANLKPAKNTN